jgi:hypothetical protein
MGERTLSFTNLSTKRQRIAELARTKRGVALSTLHHVIDLEWLKEAYRLTRKDGATGIDGATAADYAQNLEANLLDLLERIKSGRYQAPPVRRYTFRRRMDRVGPSASRPRLLRLPRGSYEPRNGSRVPSLRGPGTARFGGEAREIVSRGNERTASPPIGSLNLETSIHGQTCVLPSNTRGKNRMPELGPSGSVRGAVSNHLPRS